MTWRRIAVVLASLSIYTTAVAQEQTRVDLEGGFAFQTRNTCAIPANSDKFSYRDLIGRGPFNYARLTTILHNGENSGYRIMIAPLTFSGHGRLKSPVNFSGVNFLPGVDTYGRYTFNSYRFTWWHKWRPIYGIELRAGWSLKIRDADVTLSQGSKRSSFYNLGPVPLYYLLAEKDLGSRFKAEFEFDGLVAPEGGALDLGLQLSYRLNSSMSIQTRVRYLDGGTGSGSAYSYATINYVSLGLEYRM